jgi:transaldolase
MRPEGDRFLEIAPNLGLKIPCTLEGLRFAAEARGRAKIAITGVFTPGQAYLAAQAGADYVIAYVNRVTRFTGDGPGLIGDIVEILEPTACEVLAAGIKSAAEAVDVLLAGAQHISLPLEVIQAMAENPLTQRAVEEFEAAWTAPR